MSLHQHHSHLTSHWQCTYTALLHSFSGKLTTSLILACFFFCRQEIKPQLNDLFSLLQCQSCSWNSDFQIKVLNNETCVQNCCNHNVYYHILAGRKCISDGCCFTTIADTQTNKHKYALKSKNANKLNSCSNENATRLDNIA